MRRFGLLVLALVLMLNWQRLGTRQVRQGDPGLAKGIVTNIVKKKRTTNYYMNGVLAVDFSGKDRGLHVGDRICMTGKYKDLDDLKIRILTMEDILGLRVLIPILSYQVHICMEGQECII